MKKKAFESLCIALIGGAIFVPVKVWAYDKNLVSNVRYRPNPDYQPDGGRIGVFVVRPSVMILETFDDNIFREADSESDSITSIRPEVRISSDWTLHGIEAGATGDFGRYAEHDSENYDDYSFYLSGRYDLDYETYLDVLARFQKRHQERDTIEDPGGDEPLEYSIKTVFIGFTRDLSLLRVKASAAQHVYTHEDGMVGSTVIDNGTRDRTQQEFDLRLAYGLSDNYEIFTAVGYDRRRYDRDGVAFRDSQSTNIRGGLAVNFTGKLRGDIYAGYVHQSFNQSFGDVGLVNYGGSVLWNPSEITSVEARVGRMLVETVQTGASTIVQTTADASVAHSFRQNILGDVHVGYVDNSYEGSTGANNDSEIYKAGGGLVYKPTKSVSTGIRYDFLTRKYEVSSRDYDNNTFRVFVRYDY